MNRYVVMTCHEGTDWCVCDAAPDDEDAMSLDEALALAKESARRDGCRFYDFSGDGVPETEVDSGEDNDEAQACPMCGGHLEPMGQLGRRLHFRCRQCGAQTSHLVTP